VDPLVVTLGLEASAQARFSGLRAQHFPPGRTQVDAHVTLFHALPATLRDDVEAVLDDDAAATPHVVEVTGVRSLGRGVALELECPPVTRARARWRDRWEQHLTRQDAQTARLHVTVQNKVTAEQARRTFEELRAGFVPWRTAATSYELWRYVGGPWEHLRSFPLRG
jgi:hypothetical protein